jgi:hypothetical protein
MSDVREKLNPWPEAAIVDRCDDGLGRPAHGQVQAGQPHLEAVEFGYAHCGGKLHGLLHVQTRAEALFTVALQNDDARVEVVETLVPEALQLQHHLEVDCVVGFRPVQAQDPYTLLGHFIGDGFV